MLNDFVQKGSSLEVPSARKMLPILKSEIEEARKKGILIIYLCDAHDKNDWEFREMNWPPHALKGTEGAEVVDELKPHPGDITIKKNTYSGFYKTNLERILEKYSIRELIFTGCVTNVCILYNVYESVIRGYSVKVLKDCVAGLNVQEHKFALEQMKKILGVEVI